MSKSILFALVAAAVSAQSAFAGHRHACCAQTCCAAPACAAAGSQTGAQVSQANRGTAYQSFSYEPGTAPQMQAAPTYRPTMRPAAPPFNSFEGYRKFYGKY